MSIKRKVLFATEMNRFQIVYIYKWLWPSFSKKVESFYSKDDYPIYNLFLGPLAFHYHPVDARYL